jgi:hypothetical protein
MAPKLKGKELAAFKKAEKGNVAVLTSIVRSLVGTC